MQTGPTAHRPILEGVSANGFLVVVACASVVIVVAAFFGRNR